MILREDRRARGVEATSWIDREIAACQFADVRLGKRLHCLLEQIGDAVGESVPMACQDWANTKAAYRFFSNERVNEADILAGHFQATKDRFIATQGPILVLHDTTEFSFRRESPDDPALASPQQDRWAALIALRVRSLGTTARCLTT